MNTTKVILLKGDPGNPESAEHIIKFPGGSISVARTTNGEYWAHIAVHKDEILDDSFEESKRGTIIDARLDYPDGTIDGIKQMSSLQHIGVRIRTKE